MKEGQSSVHSIESTGPYSEIMSFLPFFLVQKCPFYYKIMMMGAERVFFFPFLFFMNIFNLGEMKG